MTLATPLKRETRKAAIARAALLIMMIGAASAGPACAASLSVREANGGQWVVIDNPDANQDNYLLQHLSVDGKADLSFGRGGASSFTLGPENDSPTSVRVDNAHQIWITGPNLAGNRPQPVVVRFRPDGSPDTRWGVQGKVQLSLSGYALRPNDLLPLSDGSVLVAGEAPQPNGAQALVIRLRADSTLDTSFANGGVWQRPGPESAAATSLSSGANGSVVVAVSVRGEAPSGEIWSLNDPRPQLIQHDILESPIDDEKARVDWVNDHWSWNTDGGPTGLIAAATLAPAIAAPASAVLASPPLVGDLGQSAFNPFAAKPTASNVSETPPENNESLPWTWLGISGALALGLGAILWRRGRRRDGHAPQKKS